MFLQQTVSRPHDGERSNRLLKQDEAGLTLLRCCALSFSTQSRSDKWRLYPLCVPPHDIYLIFSFFWLLFLVYSFRCSSAHILSLSSGYHCLSVLNALSQSIHCLQTLVGIWRETVFSAAALIDRHINEKVLHIALLSVFYSLYLPTCFISLLCETLPPEVPLVLHITTYPFNAK